MSLIYWWPFIENTTDKIQGKTFYEDPALETPLIVSETSKYWNIESGGKIGKCLGQDYGDLQVGESKFTHPTKLFVDDITIPETFSVAVWVRNDQLGSPYTYCPIQFSNGDPYIQGSVNKGWDFSHNYWRIVYNDGENFYGGLDKGNGSQSNWGSNLNTPLNSWYHIVFTVNKKTSTAELFIDGVSKGKKNIPDGLGSFGGTYQLRINWVQGWLLNGALNDLRIYDHVLSQAEINEIKRALVIHYTFDDELVEPTTNIFYNKITGFQSKWETLEETFNGWPIYRSTVTNKFTGSNAADNFGFYCPTAFDYSQVQANQPYIYMSFWARVHEVTGLNSLYGYIKFTYTDDTTSQPSWVYTKPNWSNDTSLLGQWQFVTAKLSLPSGKTVKKINNMYMYGRSCTGGIVDFACIQIEAKDRATPYTPNIREGLMCNETGLDQPISTQNLTLTTETNLGLFAGKFDNSVSGNVTQIRSKLDLSGQTDVTFACWVYPIRNCSALSDNALYTVINGTGIELYAYGRSNKWLICNNCLTYNQWNHVVTTYSATERAVYVNGERKGIDEVSDVFDKERSLDTGIGSTTSRTFNGLISDYRVYKTTLSEQEIKNLYESRASITKQGIILTKNFAENQQKVSVDKKFMVKEKEIIEGYTHIDYIQADGTQYIDLEIGNSDDFAFDIAVSDVSGGYILTQGNYGLRHKLSTVYNYLTNRHLYIAGTTVMDNDITYIQGSNSTLIVNGNSNFVEEEDIDSPNSTYKIFRGHPSFQNYSSGKVYYCKLWKNGVLVRDLVPVRRYDGVIGLYDLVENKLYTSATESPLIYDSDKALASSSFYKTGQVFCQQAIEN